MKKLLLLLLTVLLYSCATTKEESLPDEAVARVYGEYIDRETFYQKVETYKIVFRTSQNREPDPDEVDSIQENLLTNLIEKKIYLRKFDELGLSYEQGMVDAQLQEIIASFGSREIYLNELEKNGFTENDFIEEITYQFKMKELGNYVQNLDEVITDEDIDKYYNDNKKDFYDSERIKAKASHILIKTDTLSDDEALVKIKEIKEEIENGKEFSEAAKEYSQCPSSAQGGDLGEFGQGRMVPEFDAKVFTMDLNTVSEPVKTQFGYHLILTTERENSGYIPKEDIADHLILKIKEERFTNQCKEEAQVLRLSW